MAEVPFSAHDVNSQYSAVDGEVDLEDGSKLIWGLSRKEFGPMSFQGRPEWDVAHNRMMFLRRWDLKIDMVIAPHLGHTANVQVVTKADKGKGARSWKNAFDQTDGLLTKEKDLVLMTTHADCLPVWFYAPSGWIGVAHVGWRGMYAGILENMIESIPEEERSGLSIAVGPGISARHYEVGEEVISLFKEHEQLAGALESRSGRTFFDMVKGAAQIVQAKGYDLYAEMFTCTYSNDYLSSFRRDGKPLSPMGAFITRT